MGSSRIKYKTGRSWYKLIDLGYRDFRIMFHVLGKMKLNYIPDYIIEDMIVEGVIKLFELGQVEPGVKYISVKNAMIDYLRKYLKYKEYHKELKE